MKKLFIVFGIVCLAFANPVLAKTTNTLPSESSQVLNTTDQRASEVFEKFLERIGFDLDKIEVIENNDDKECTMTIKGTVDVKEVDLTITIKGQTCAEFFKDLL